MASFFIAINKQLYKLIMTNITTIWLKRRAYS